ncbi:phage-related terminase small subunit-like protein,Uncharacterized conserved protein,Phage terminase small subunit [[Clostridium] sordellii]|nr:phage-related terminase small subunit-like protein,Uncharacterized conserved protein,Phage terminase small subunit [[Clostridium] sordellii] [Paeniclostridium sordellii]
MVYIARTRNPNRDKALEIYIKNKGNIKISELAEVLNEKPKTVSSWKSKDRWNEKLPRVGAPKGNQNAKGSRGNKNAKGAPKGNLNTYKHGQYIDNTKYMSKNFLSKYIPKATENIIEEIEENGLSPLDILWMNITTQFAAIIRSQNIMYVKDKHDLTKELKRSKVQERETQKTSSSIKETEFEIQFAWDKQATFLQTQTKAMKTLEGLINSYEKLLHKNWDLATEEQKARITKIKQDTQYLQIKKDTEKIKLDIEKNKVNRSEKVSNPLEGLSTEELKEIIKEYKD